MDSELEKKMLQKLKNNLEKPKEDAFESDDVVDNLRDEFKQEDIKEKGIASQKSDELAEDKLEDELIDDDFKKSKEDFLENEIITKSVPRNYEKENNDNKTELTKEKIEEKLNNSQNEQINLANSSGKEIQTPTNAQLIKDSEPQAEPIISENSKPTLQPAPIKKKSRLGLIIFLFILFAVLIVAVMLFI
jgi:hypothetical protein